MNEGGKSRRHRVLPFGAEVLAGGGVRFRLFAPAEQVVRLAMEGREPVGMVADGRGWHELTVADAGAGARYRYVLGDGLRVPDPVSRFQPEDVAGASEVIDPGAYVWGDVEWRGRPWAEAVLYELHVGTFTTEGTLRAAAGRLDHLARLGVTAVELMALGDFAGRWNWGYDGVLLYAPDSAYGRPEDLKAFVEAAHGRGIQVILDVVYNHFGPEGNYLPRYFPAVLSKENKTAWGEALNFDGPGSAEVRALVVENALYWVEEFNLDGLRLDATHAMIDRGPRHILVEIAERVKEVAGGRQVHLILENENNIARLLTRAGGGGCEGYTAQWNHDIDHLLGAGFLGGFEGREADDGGETERLGKALSEGFVIAAQEQGKEFEAGCHVPPNAFVSFVQSHDLVGNRIFGDRVTGLLGAEAVRALVAVALLLPQTPMLFMGEEWGATTPFPYFCDFHGKLGEAVRRGRCEQLSKQAGVSAEDLRRAPDAQAEGTFLSAKLRWEELDGAEHAAWLGLYEGLLRVRRERIVPLLQGLCERCGHYRVVGPGGLAIRWTLAGGRRLRLDANLWHRARGGFAAVEGGEVIWAEGEVSGGEELGAWGVRWVVGE